MRCRKQQRSEGSARALAVGQSTSVTATVQSVEDLMRCGYVEATHLVSTFGDPSVLDPRLDPDILGAANSIFSTDEFGRSAFFKTGSVMTAAAFILVHDPAGRPALTRPTAGQIGWFRTNGDLETGATRVSNNVDRLAEAIVLNYLALHDEMGRLAQVLPAHGLGSTAEIDSLIAFAPIRAAGP